MRRATLVAALALSLTIATAAAPALAQDAAPAPSGPIVYVLMSTAPVEIPPPDMPAAVPIPAQPITVDYAAATRYYLATVYAYVASLPADQLIRLRWADTPHVATMLRIAQHESHFNCAADNPTSSAAGLFQTMGSWRTLAESMGLKWSDITGPDCMADIALAWRLYNGGKGLTNWRGAY
jgi:hypothetical protein